MSMYLNMHFSHVSEECPVMSEVKHCSSCQTRVSGSALANAPLSSALPASEPMSISWRPRARLNQGSMTSLASLSRSTSSSSGKPSFSVAYSVWSLLLHTSQNCSTDFDLASRRGVWPKEQFSYIQHLGACSRPFLPA